MDRFQTRIGKVGSKDPRRFILDTQTGAKAYFEPFWTSKALGQVAAELGKGSGSWKLEDLSWKPL